jgi:2-polyprenyl-6-methoxyphenol hydroxylase-like FAD-dependent oxidoreductase
VKKTPCWFQLILSTGTKASLGHCLNRSNGSTVATVSFEISILELRMDIISRAMSASSRNRPRVAVIGAGIGGMTLAGLLRQAGYAYTVYEQAPNFRRVGAGINLAPNSTRVFRAMGLEPAMLKAGLRPRSKVNREWDTGKAFFVADVPALAQRFGAPFIAFHRGDLHGALATAADVESVQLGKRLVSLEIGSSGVKIEFDDGTSATADAVIGADGLHSNVRRAILGPEQPTYYGHAAYRSIFPREQLAHLDLPDHTRWWGPDRYVLVYFMKEARDEVYVVTGGVEEWGSNDFTPMPVDPQRLVAAFPGFHPDVQLILRQCKQVSRWPMLVRPSTLPWSCSRVTLLGDACHPMTPHLGQGGGMAIEDAVMIVRCLESVEGEDVALAFRIYEANRFERTARAQREAQRDEFGRGKVDQQWLYGFDVLTEPIQPLPDLDREKMERVRQRAHHSTKGC